MLEYETFLIENFIDPDKIDRYKMLLGNPKKRRDAIQKLIGKPDLRRKLMIHVPPKDQNPTAIYKALKAKGAEEKCYALSENRSLDQRVMSLEDALLNTIGFGKGTLLYCFPKKLAYFEAEAPNERYILIVK